MTTVRVKSAIVNTKELCLYLENGETIYIPQGDERLKRIVEEITPVIASNNIAVVNLEQNNNYHDFEQKAGGIVRFFRTIKKAVAHIFESGAPTVEEQTIAPPSVNEPTPGVNKITKAVNEIIANAEPVSSKEYVQEKTTSEHTIIAVVDDKIIPGMENLEPQFRNAAKLGSTIGVERFLQRIAAVIDQRGHSVNDLLRFMEKGDLPIADDGSIIAYKRLYKQGNKADVFVDPHSRKVLQKVGSHVFMSPSMVDPNRHHECSNGLHIGRRKYMGSFEGDVMTICKINPEDVIAVPDRDANKVRVSGYHILAKLSQTGMQEVLANRPMTGETEMAKLLGAIIKGDHVGILETVEITGPKGTGLKINNVVSEGKAREAVKESIETAKKAEPAVALDDPKAVAGPVDAKTVANNIKTAKEADKPVLTGRNQQARNLFNNKDYSALNDLKKKAKISWTKLGFGAAEEQFITNQVAKLSETKPVETMKAQPEPTKTKAKAVKAEKPTKTPESKKEEPKVDLSTMTRQQKARHHFDLAVKGDKASWTHLWLLKKQAKKSWEQLGFTKKEAERIQTNKPDHV